MYAPSTMCPGPYKISRQGLRLEKGHIQSLTASASDKNTEMIEKGSQSPFPCNIREHRKS